MINYTSLVVSIINPNYYLNRLDKSNLFSCIFFQYVNERFSVGSNQSSANSLNCAL